MDQSGGEMLLQFVPSIILGCIYAFLVFILARKRGLSPWGWTIATLVPLVGLVVAAVFFFLSFMSVFDRLNALEAGATEKAP